MSEILAIPAAEILPGPDRVLQQQGVTKDLVGGPVREVAESACEKLATLLAPRGMLADLDAAAFGIIYEGQGENAGRTPLAEIHPQAEALALFAVTAGPGVGREITRLFAAHDYAPAAALDAAASLATDAAAQWAQEHFAARCASTAGVMRYSPGYCGWHMSGQTRLFDALEPHRIGMSLSECFLMDPLKSVSGVIVVGPPAIFEFVNDFEFCGSCTGLQCRDRIAHVLDPPGKET